MLWQAVTLWLVNRGMAVRRGWLVEQVCDRKETKWYENHAVRFRQSVQRIKSRARDTQPIRGVRSSLTIRLARGYKRWHPLATGRRYGARRSPLPKYMSLHLSLKLTTKCVPFLRIKWQRYIFYKEVCFSSFNEDCSLSLIVFLFGSIWDYTTVVSELEFLSYYFFHFRSNTLEKVSWWYTLWRHCMDPTRHP